MNNRTVSALSLAVIVAVLVALHLLRETPPRINLEVPFAGTPAEQWADGGNGIVAPGDDLVFGQVRQALIASRIDLAMLVDHRPEHFLTMVAPPVRDEIARNLPGWTTRIKAGTTLLGIKVAGRMTLGEKDGYPTVTTDYVFAYAFRPPEPAKLRGQREMVAVSRHQVSFTITPEGLWPSSARGFHYSVACGAARDGFLAPQFTEPSAPGSGMAADDRRFFSAGEPMPAENTCD
ncbi:hypothetical protein [Lentzea sp. NPDC055074]